MAVEIEKKHLIHRNLWDTLSKSPPERYIQGYIHSDPQKTIRIRVTPSHAYLTIKGATQGATRPEYEYHIPQQDARDMLHLFAPLYIEKDRYKIPHQGHTWEIDVFYGANEGLIVAEIELQAENEIYAIPDWVAEEVTQDKRYSNSNLIHHPYKNW